MQIRFEVQYLLTSRPFQINFALVYQIITLQCSVLVLCQQIIKLKQYIFCHIFGTGILFLTGCRTEPEPEP